MGGWGGGGRPGWKGRSMLFKPELKDDAKTAGKRVARGIGRRMVSLTVTLLILGGLGYLAWNAFQQKQTGRGRPRGSPGPPGPAAPAVSPREGTPLVLPGQRA